MTYRVPRSLLVSEIGPDGRLAAERRILTKHFPQFRLDESRNQGELAAAAGSLTTFTGKRYTIKIVLGNRYPHELPAVTTPGWTPQRNPHMIGGTLCVMKSTQWHSLMSIAFIVAKSALWLNKYEIFLDRKIWPGPEQHVHGPIYTFRKRLNDLG
ncbi:hypothetical protein [Pseudonocardia lacus]|uniref:hypothetical protein n=1 Tax=Pseudonocardia lacus TaxID=2835865 RepID=UPI001BDBB9B0|nr:hypothetical protein [Pseudonocardia lacus]